MANLSTGFVTRNNIIFCLFGDVHELTGCRSCGSSLHLIRLKVGVLCGYAALTVALTYLPI